MARKLLEECLIGELFLECMSKDPMIQHVRRDALSSPDGRISLLHLRQTSKEIATDETFLAVLDLCAARTRQHDKVFSWNGEFFLDECNGSQGDRTYLLRDIVEWGTKEKGMSTNDVKIQWGDYWDTMETECSRDGGVLTKTDKYAAVEFYQSNFCFRTSDLHNKLHTHSAWRRLVLSNLRRLAMRGRKGVHEVHDSYWRNYAKERQFRHHQCILESLKLCDHRSFMETLFPDDVSYLPNVTGYPRNFCFELRAIVDDDL